MPYDVAPIFLIRMAGAPFDILQSLATTESSRIGREIIQSRARFASAKAEAETLLAQRDNGLSPEEFHALRAAVRAGTAPRITGSHPQFTAYTRAASELTGLEQRLVDCLGQELPVARAELLRHSRELLPRYLIFAGRGATELLGESLKEDEDIQAQRNKRARERERHLLLYLQRIAAKNDTFSEFGPSGWGNADTHDVLSIAPEAGVATREGFLERWTAQAVAAAVHADPESPNKLVVPALEPHAFDLLVNDARQWPAGAARDKWLSVLEPLEKLPGEFIGSSSLPHRQAVLEQARTQLQSLGAERRTTERFLYAATNPIGEECFRECHFSINQTLLNKVATEAGPWIDLWRDTYAFVASRVAGALRQLMVKAGAGDGPVPLLQFMQAAAAARLPLQGPGMVAPAVIAFQEVKAAVRKQLGAHLDRSEYELTRNDCEVVRRSFDFPRFDEYTFPSADLQLAAADIEAVNRGDYRWILAELHPPVALLHHGGYWSCPDKPALNAALASTALGKPNMHFGFFAADFTAHTTVRMFDAMPQLTNFVAPQRGNPNWRCIPPNECEVYVDPDTSDVAVRRIDNQEHLGSFARAWVIPLGFHPFQFSFAPSTPRLRCGKVIVQRRAWTLALEEFPAGKYQGVSPQLITAVEELRTERNLPRHVYIRPTEQALRRSGAEGRDKDTKPIYIDLESYLFIEIFHRWLTKAGEIEITEMLPAPNELVWPETDGRRTFELRTLIVPKEK